MVHMWCNIIVLQPKIEKRWLDVAHELFKTYYDEVPFDHAYGIVSTNQASYEYYLLSSIMIPK